jgi:hypothetical protein
MSCAGGGLRIAMEAGVDSIEHGCYLDEEPELLDAMAQRGIFFVPTFAVYDFHRKSALPHILERAHHLREHHAESLRRAFAAGVKIAAGTDAGGHGHPSNALEIECLVAIDAAPGIAGGRRLGAESLPRRDPEVERQLADLIVVAGTHSVSHRPRTRAAAGAQGQPATNRLPEPGRCSADLAGRRVTVVQQQQ